METKINKLISELKYGLIDEYNFLGDTDEDQIERFNEVKKWSLNKSEEDLKNFYGQPNKVEFLKTRNRNYIYFTEKYKIKCERKFELNPRNIVVGFSSKNCF